MIRPTLPSFHVRDLSPAWQSALIGALVSLPVAVVVNWMPNSETTISGSLMIIGAFIAGVIAALRSADPDAAGFRAGLLAGAVGVSTLILSVVGDALSGGTEAWPLYRVVFFGVAGVLFLCVAPLFGLVFGHVGGGLTNTVVSRLVTGTTES